jgi:Fur family ferric uptake transcriptional regulator/Fur family peroxide stress response transcriptional regulator
MMKVKVKKRNTRQKAVVLQVVLSSNDHPTAEQVYERAKRELPNISLGTVYRILKELVQQGKLKEIVINKQSRFDRRTDPHHHFICKSCGMIEDVETPLCFYVSKKLEEKGYEIEEVEYKFYGYCKNCAKTKNR